MVKRRKKLKKTLVDASELSGRFPTSAKTRPPRGIARNSVDSGKGRSCFEPSFPAPNSQAVMKTAVLTRSTGSKR